MPYSKTGRVSKPKDVLVQDLDGEAVLLNLTSGLYYGLDSNSYHMYKTLLASNTIHGAYDVLLTEYDVDPSQLKTDFDQFVDILLNNGLLDEADQESV